MPEDSEKKNPFKGKVISETDIPAKSGRKPAWNWEEEVFSKVPEGSAVEIDTDQMPKGTLLGAVKGTKYKVTVRTIDGEEKVFLRNPAPTK